MTFSIRRLIAGRIAGRIVGGVLAGALIVAGCGGDDTATAPGATADGALPGGGTALQLVGGGQLDLGDLEGRDVVLWFWAPW